VICNQGDGQRPVPPFLSLEFTGTTTLGMPDYGPVETGDPLPPGGVRTISRPVRRALTMYAFGERALDLLETVKASAEMDAYVEMLAEKGLVVSDTLEAREHPAARGGGTEASAMFEFYVTYIRVLTESPGYIETVHIAPPENIPMDEITNEEEKNG